MQSQVMSGSQSSLRVVHAKRIVRTSVAVPASQQGQGRLAHSSCSLRRATLPGQQRGRRRCVQTHASYDGDGNNKDIGDRVIASLPYMLPLLDSIPFGKFIFLQYPFVARAMAPLGPVASLYNSFPFAPLIIFLGVFNGIVNNQNLPRFVRFNAMQAVLLDVLLIIPQVLMGSLFRNPGNDPLALQAYITVNNTIFLFVAVSVAYGMGASLVGQQPRLPLVAEAAESQLRGPGGF